MIKTLAYLIALTLVLCSGARPPVVIGESAPPTASSMPVMVERWDRSFIRHSWLGRVDKVTRRIKNHKKRYERTSAKCGVPWEVIAALHNMESGGSFTRHLHEGSSLKGRTRYVPKGRPVDGSPPFTWEESAYDVLCKLKRMDRIKWSDLGVSLYQCRLYNGNGYARYHNMASPYLWNGTLVKASASDEFRRDPTGKYLKYTGKYIADGKWSESAVSKQVGVAPILIKLGYFKHPHN